MHEYLEIRKLPPSAVRELGLILDHADKWKDLMAIIPKQLSKNNFCIEITKEIPAKYNSEHIQIIDNGAKKFQKSPTAILIDEWGTSGRNRATLGHLLNLLVKANLYRAADYISVDLLKKDPVPRPDHGPASPVRLEWSDFKHLLEEKNDLSPIVVPREIQKKQCRMNISKSDNDVKIHLRKFRSLGSILRDIEKPVNGVEATFYIDSDSESVVDEPICEEMGANGQRNQGNINPCGVNAVSLKDSPVKDTAEDKHKWSLLRIANLVRSKVVSKKDSSDLIMFSSTSSKCSSVSSRKSNRKKKKYREDNIFKGNSKEYMGNTEKRSYSGEANNQNSPESTAGTPNLSMLLNGNSLLRPNDNYGGPQPSKSKNLIQHPPTRITISCEHNEINIDPMKNNICQTCQDASPHETAVDRNQDCLCPNIPAFSKIFTDPVLFKLGEMKSRNTIVVKIEKKIRRNSL